ncbi:MAG: purine-nucleoside phosphorylase [Rhodospirillales bacterium]|nr:purine-nucleoside phosphorylase [Rhodospirillales bacterium]
MLSNDPDAEHSARIIRERAGDLGTPSFAIVLGSGLGAVADALTDAVAIPFGDLPGFPLPLVRGHAGRLVLGRLGGRDVAVMQGRAHYYEAGDVAAMKVPLRALAITGCPAMIFTNSAGSLRLEVGPGSLMMITDHINFAAANPLIGEPGEESFVDMTEAYDAELRARLRAAAGRLDIPLHEGVYAWFSGPSFETPAEIHAARTLGADAVGMSTVPEVLLARWLGLRIAALSIIANPAAGMAGKALTHETSVTEAARAADDLTRLLTTFLEDGAAA